MFAMTHDKILEIRAERIEQLEECIREAFRFLDKAQRAVRDITQQKNCYGGTSHRMETYPEFTTTKRASLDLARAMVKLRKPIE